MLELDVELELELGRRDTGPVFVLGFTSEFEFEIDCDGLGPDGSFGGMNAQWSA